MKNVAIPTTRQELAELYKIDRKTLNEWLLRAAIQVEPRERIKPIQLKEIFQKFGHPADLYED